MGKKRVPLRIELGLGDGRETRRDVRSPTAARGGYCLTFCLVLARFFGGDPGYCWTVVSNRFELCEYAPRHSDRNRAGQSKFEKDGLSGVIL